MYTKIKRTLTPFPRASNPYVLKKIYTFLKKYVKKFGYPRGGSYIYTVNDEVMIDTWTKEQFLQCISDLYKDAFGVRPRGINYNEWTRDELHAEWKRLEKIAIDEFWFND